MPRRVTRSNRLPRHKKLVVRAKRRRVYESARAKVKAWLNEGPGRVWVHSRNRYGVNLNAQGIQLMDWKESAIYSTISLGED